LVDYFKKLYSQGNDQRAQQSEFLERLSLPMVPREVHRSLMIIPTTIEILKCLRKMGLDKAPKSDGFVVKFLVKEWWLISPEVMRKILEIFYTVQAPEAWMLNHLMLIPKRENTSTHAHFQSLSACSVYYRLLTKIIENRIKPLLPSLISNTQTTFQKGRSIQENVLIMAEVLHSF
jgi:Reverse transcriptase (RNA-dependent DNA polymerase)